MGRRVKDFIEISEYTSLDQLINTLTAATSRLLTGVVRSILATTLLKVLPKSQSPAWASRQMVSPPLPAGAPWQPPAPQLWASTGSTVVARMAKTQGFRVAANDWDAIASRMMDVMARARLAKLAPAAEAAAVALTA